MSNKANDLYLEELKEADEEVKDCMEAFNQADKDLTEAIKWQQSRRIKLEQAQRALLILREKEV